MTVNHKNLMVKTTSIQGLLILERPKHQDERGFFREIFHLDEVEEALNAEFNGIQMNHAYSEPSVLRGIHAESWNKIVYPINGQIFAAIADIRTDSPTFGKVETFVIDDLNKIALFVSKGLANSYCVTFDAPVDYIYLVDSYYDGTDTRAVAWDDPDLNIAWPIERDKMIISQRDKDAVTLRQKFPQKFT